MHGAWQGDWCWDELRTALDAESIETRAVDLSSARGSNAELELDTLTVRETLAEIEGPVVVVTHSHGGILVTQAAAEAPNVVGVVYLASFQLDAGEDLTGFDSAPASADLHEVEPVPDDPIALFFAGVARRRAEEAARHIVPQSAASFRDVAVGAGWRRIPSVHIVCEQDRTIPAQVQEVLAARADEVHRIASCHSPFLSAPAELTALLSQAARTAWISPGRTNASQRPVQSSSVMS
ncbi:alpha/beta hydrolase [Streptomyces sp. NPDC051098]|uniref:alpha/beta hydrolase n=1 Tax=Streptomyces sp. NPDC051098 TaxID=3155411 RepID=UPI0034421A54